MLHIAQPENGLWWFEQASACRVYDYDWIGLSYYPMWSEYDLNSIDTAIKTLIETYNKRLMIVETGYPFTLNNADSANNIFNENALITGYPASEQGQLNYLNDLKTKYFKVEEKELYIGNLLGYQQVVQHYGQLVRIGIMLLYLIITISLT